MNGSRLFVCMLVGLSVLPGETQDKHAARPDARSKSSLTAQFFNEFNVKLSAERAARALRRNPADPAALFVRMETAELQDNAAAVLDSALRLCRLNAGGALAEIASNRVLEHSGNTAAFNAVLPRVQAGTAAHGACAPNLSLALVNAAADGDTKLPLDRTARAAGVLTHWKLVGPFGHYSNSGFDRTWEPESDRFSRRDYGSLAAEQFWFRDGIVAIPDYFASSGVFYASSEVELHQLRLYELTVASPGPYVLSVDGRSVLMHDTRYRYGPSVNSASLALPAGKHRIIMKFTPDAAPFRVSLRTDAKPSSGNDGLPNADGSQPYVEAMRAYFSGDSISLQQIISDTKTPEKIRPYLQALLGSGLDEQSAATYSAWQALAQQQPGLLLPLLKSARIPPQNLVASSLLAAADRNPGSETAVHLAFQAWRSDPAKAVALLRRLLALHSSCEHLDEALDFYQSNEETAAARRTQDRLRLCSPGSLDYPRVLAGQGDHETAATVLRQMVTENPWDRNARRLLVRELLLAGNESLASIQAKRLHELAPGSADFARWALNPESSLDNRSPRAAGFAQNKEFYAPYRKDGFATVKAAAGRKFSGGPAVVLLEDKVVRFSQDGGVSIYHHTITRLLNKDGIARYGEVSLPRGSDLLELRTIKANVEAEEPELAQQKPSISMPALEPGDSIEEEYVEHYDALEEAPRYATKFTFGSLEAPVLSARLITIVPRTLKVTFQSGSGAPAPQVSEEGGDRIYSWTAENIAQTVKEPFAPENQLLAYVEVFPATDLHEQIQDQLADATRIGPEVLGTVLSLPASQAETEQAATLYRFVTTRLESSEKGWAEENAEDTLAKGQGSRTDALLALAREAGLRADLVLAGRVDSCEEDGVHCFDVPLVRFHFANSSILDVDAESDGLALGAVPPELERGRALLVSPGNEESAWVSLAPRKSVEERSRAHAALTLNRDGSLDATIRLRLGATRGGEVRTALHGLSGAERQAYYEQFAQRIFPGARAVSGLAVHETDSESPLELTVSLSVPDFARIEKGRVEISQVLPPLGLRELYAAVATRTQPLAIDSLSDEDALFSLSLPAGVQPGPLPADLTLHKSYGDYTLRFGRHGQQISIRREFRIPVQVIQAAKYAGFVEFASRIQEAERQPIVLLGNGESSPIRPSTQGDNQTGYRIQ